MHEPHELSPVKSRHVRRWSLALAASGLTMVIACGGEQTEVTPATPPATESETSTTSTTSSASTTASPTAAAPAAPPTETAPPAAGLDPTGAYFAMSDLPAEFNEIEHLSLATIDENAAPAPLNGFLRPKAKSADDYKLINPTLSGTSLTFTTAAVKGVHYTFTGAFQRIGNFAEAPPAYEDVALSGTLTKLRDGQPIATTPVNFRYEAGG